MTLACPFCHTKSFNFFFNFTKVWISGNRRNEWEKREMSDKKIGLMKQEFKRNKMRAQGVLTSEGGAPMIGLYVENLAKVKGFYPPNVFLTLE